MCVLLRVGVRSVSRSVLEYRRPDCGACVCVCVSDCVCVWVRVIHLSWCDSALKFEWIASPRRRIAEKCNRSRFIGRPAEPDSTPKFAPPARARTYMPSILRAVLFQMQYASLIHITRMSLTHAAHCSWAFEFENAALRMPARAWSPS